MALTRRVEETVQARVVADRTLRGALLRDSVQAMLGGDVDVGKAILRDYIRATVGFETLAAVIGTPRKSLTRMFAPSGSLRTRSLFAVLRHLQKDADVTLHVRGRRA